MITVSGRFRVMCIALVAAALFLIISNGALAQTNSAAPDEQIAPCQAKPALCQNTAPCCQPSQARQGIVSRINRFLAFGCRLNYQIDGWILSDKCDMGK